MNPFSLLSQILEENRSLNCSPLLSYATQTENDQNSKKVQLEAFIFALFNFYTHSFKLTVSHLLLTESPYNQWSKKLALSILRMVWSKSKYPKWSKS